MGLEKMKCIFYVSKVVARRNGAVIPSELSKITKLIRQKNSEFNISGVLTYQGGHYLQILEGEANNVDQLFSNILVDPRHEQITTLLEKPITHRAFKTWNMKLFEPIAGDLQFQAFVESNFDTLATLAQNKRKYLDVFYPLTNSPKKDLNIYQGKELMLSSWPDFRIAEPPQIIIEFCAMLLQRPFSYEDLIARRDFGGQQQLDQILDRFNALGILQLSDPQPKMTQIQNRHRSPDLYLRMKSLLKMS